MSLNKLISKYLDGQLTSKEDTALRSLLSENEAARDKFDAAVHLHIAFREDAKSIKAPEDLVRETEDIILMEILNQPPVVMANKKLGRGYFYTPYVLGMLIIFFLSGVIEIHDLNKSYGPNNFGPLAESIMPEAPADKLVNSLSEDNNSARPVSPQNETAERNVPSVGKPVDHSLSVIEPSDDTEKVSEHIALVLNPDDSPETVAGSPAVSAFGAAAGLSFPEPIIPADDNSPEYSDIESILIDSDGTIDIIAARPDGVHGTESSRLESEGLPALSLSPSGSAGSGLSSTNNPIINNGNSAIFNLNQLADLYELNDVQITTFAGTDFYRKGVESKGDAAISHVSQSIAYGVGNVSRIGVEFGYTQYSFDEQMTVTVPAGKATAYSSIEVAVDPINDEGGFIAIPIDFNRQQQLFWGAVFYEHTIFDNYGLSLIARGGFGGSSDGLLGYTRLFGKLEIISGVFFNVGTEFRTFMSSVPQFSGQSEWKETGSWIYGLQFKL